MDAADSIATCRTVRPSASLMLLPLSLVSALLCSEKTGIGSTLNNTDTKKERRGEEEEDSKTSQRSSMDSTPAEQAAPGKIGAVPCRPESEFGLLAALLPLVM